MHYHTEQHVNGRFVVADAEQVICWAESKNDADRICASMNAMQAEMEAKPTVGAAEAGRIVNELQRKNRVFRLTKEDSCEIGHKLGVMADTPELAEGYGLHPSQAESLRASVPHNGGDWEVPVWAWQAVSGEMLDHVEVLRTQAGDARSGGEMGQSLRISKHAARLERMFQ